MIILVQTTVTVSLACGEVAFEHVTVGFNGGYKAGKWAPLNVTVRSQSEPATFTGELVVEVRNFFSDALIQRYATPLQLSTTDRRHRQLYVYFPKIATKIVIQLVRTEEYTKVASTIPMPKLSATQEISPQPPMARKDYFILALTPSRDRLQQFVDKKQLNEDEAQVHVRYLPNSRALPLPTQWIGYSAVDVLVIREVLLTERRVSQAQQTALLDWVQRGGTLVVSGGSNFNYLNGSFIEAFLPVQLRGVETVETRDTVPSALQRQLDTITRPFSSKTKASSLAKLARRNRQNEAGTGTTNKPEHSPGKTTKIFERIQFALKAGCETLIGTAEEIYVAKRNFGDGQILCLAFDYNAPPFSEQLVAESFWHWLLKKHGKSPRHLADRYGLALQHEEKIYQQFLSKMPTQVPLIKLLSIVLPIYLLSFGGFLIYFRKSKQKPRTYWIGGCLFVLLSMSAIAGARNVLPNSITADRLSILSVYPEQERAHLQSYVSLRAIGRAEISIAFSEGTFIRHQEIERSGAEPPQKIGRLIQGAHVQLRDLVVGPWHPTTYVKETFLTLDTQELARTLEHKWHITGQEMTYLGNVPLGNELEPDPSTVRLRLRMTSKMPPNRELGGTRQTFAQILQREYVLRYLTAKRDSNAPPYLIGWTSQGFTDKTVDRNVTSNNETLVIFRHGTKGF